MRIALGVGYIGSGGEMRGPSPLHHQCFKAHLGRDVGVCSPLPCFSCEFLGTG